MAQVFPKTCKSLCGRTVTRTPAFPATFQKFTEPIQRRQFKSENILFLFFNVLRENLRVRFSIFETVSQQRLFLQIIVAQSAIAFTTCSGWALDAKSRSE
jgi:hypothetical protein